MYIHNNHERMIYIQKNPFTLFTPNNYIFFQVTSQHFFRDLEFFL